MNLSFEDDLDLMFLTQLAKILQNQKMPAVCHLISIIINVKTIMIFPFQNKSEFDEWRVNTRIDVPLQMKLNVIVQMYVLMILICHVMIKENV